MTDTDEANQGLPAGLTDLLRTVNTPTVCNAIEVAQGRRGFDRFTRGTVLCADQSLPAFFGFARTARLRASVPSSDAPEAVRARRMAYYRYMSEGSPHRLAVIEDLDGAAAVGAFWGEVNTTVHRGLGISGALTNGVMRDLGDLAPGFQVLAGSIGPSHAYVHVTDIDVPVQVFGLRIEPGEFVHADRHGAVVVPADILPQLAAAVAGMQASEQHILAPAREPGFSFTEFEKAWAAFEQSRV